MEQDVSVVVPTFDRVERVCRALESIEAQTHPPEEILVVDDGSIDGTAQRVRREFPRVRLLRQENRGVSAARNRGLEVAEGSWIAFLDSDDLWRPTKIERQLAALARSSDLVCHTDEVWIRDGRRVNPRRRHKKPSGWVYRDCLPLCAISPSAVILHRSVFEEVGVFDESLPVCEDYDLWLRVAARFRVQLVDEALVVKHGGHADQLSRSLPAMDLYRVRALARAWRELDLVSADRLATLEILVEKLGILAQGARKRSRHRLLGELEAQLAHFRTLLSLEEAAA